MSEKLLNESWIKFVREEVINPYKNEYEKEFTLVFNLMMNAEWRDMMIDRLASIYSHIDFSFFPNTTTGQALRKLLMNAGIKETTPKEE